MTKILFIRHALTDAIGKRFSGRTPGVHLNNEGQIQAQKLAERLTGLSIAAIYSSPLERAVETAQPIAKQFNLPCITLEDFTEIDFGRWTNCTFEERESDPLFKNFNSYRSGTRIPEGELMLETQLRMIKGLEKLHAQYQNNVVAVVSHADTIKSAIAFYAGIPIDMCCRIEISPASISIIELHEESARILLLNGTGQIRV